MYTIEQLPMITGLTTRTLRNYLKSGILKGCKDTGAWQFTERQVSEFVDHPSVRPSIQAKHRAIVYDFLADQDQSENELCMLLNRTVNESKAKEIADFFCKEVKRLSYRSFAYAYEAGKGLYSLKGSEADVSKIMTRFYQGEF